MGLGVAGSVSGVEAEPEPAVEGDPSVEAGGTVVDGVGLDGLPEPEVGLGSVDGMVAGGPLGVTGVTGGVVQGGVPELEGELVDPSEPDPVGTEVVVEVVLDGVPGSPATGVVGVSGVLGQAVGGAKVGAAPKKATRSVEMLEGWASVT
jgi:hypothetical protein